jgi:phosphomevalonate kinase
MAVNRRAGVSIQSTKSDEHIVSSPGFAEGSYRFSVDAAGNLEWQAAAKPLPDFSLLECAWAAMNPVVTEKLEVELDTRAFVDVGSGRKLGLGGSAALMVALSAALARLQRQSDGVDQMIESHRRFQSGRGSGVDVATAFSGGLIEYRSSRVASIRTHTWPRELEFAVLWSGQSASTARNLEKFEAANTDGRSRQELGAASTAIVNAWAESDVENIVALIEGYTKTLMTFSDDHGLGIFDAGHSELFDLAGGHGVSYKPCGAGGGDVGMVLSADRKAVDGFIEAAAAHGFHHLDLVVDDTGLTRQESE